MTNLTTLSNLYRQFVHYYQEYQDPNYQVSKFWQEIFTSRQNFPDLNEFLTFQRGKFLVGVGKDHHYSQQDEKQIWDRYKMLVEKSVPNVYLSKLKEPILGAPIFFQDNHCQMSASYLLNTIHSYKINQIIQSLEIENPKIAEIGAGWGAMAEQLLQTAKPQSYSIIDLPENLCISSLYLTLSHAEYSHQFISDKVKETDGLNFIFPHLKDRLTQQYDVIINSFSFQEMDLKTVQDYLNWCHAYLSEKGVIISINSHNKTNLKAPADYLHSGFKIIGMESFRETPPQLLNTVPYLLIMTKGAQNVSALQLNQLGYLTQLGFNLNYLTKLPKMDNYTQEKTVKPIFEAFTQLYNNQFKKHSLSLPSYDIHPFAVLKFALMAYSKKAIKTIPPELIEAFPWLSDEIHTLMKSNPRKSLNHYFNTLLEPLLEVTTVPVFANASSHEAI